MGAILSSAVSVYFRGSFWIRFFGLFITIAFVSGAFYTSYYAWGVENGVVISTCSMGAGFPSFMPLDQWIPFFFGANGPCGQSPDMWFGLSMVETLLVTLGIPLLILSLVWITHLPFAISSYGKIANA